MKNVNFKIGAVYGSFYTVASPNEEIFSLTRTGPYLWNVAEFTIVECIITKDSAGKVDVAWRHDDLTDGKLPIAAYDLEYDVWDGFWAVVQEHISMLNAGDFPVECIEYDF